jgi:acid phosphatase
MRTSLRFLLSAALLALPACAHPRGGPAALHTHEGLHATLWLQTAAEYRANTLQAFRSATVHLDLALADGSWTAALEQQNDFASLPPAIILDMDEAIIRSDRYQASLVRNDTSYDLESWNAWVRTETAEATPGALDYVHDARARGVQVFYVTNRTAEVEQPTLETLRKLGFPVEGGADDLLTQDERPEWTSDKSSRRAYVCRSHRVLQIVGDNLNDFVRGTRIDPAGRRAVADRYASYWGTRWIIMPNPAYGDWNGALFDFDYRLPRAEQLRRQYEHLDTWN